MGPHQSLILKLTAMVCVLLPSVMALLHWRWPDIPWGFLLLFGLQVLLLLASLQLMLTSIWGPESRWNLPKPTPDPQRRIFGQKRAFMARLRALVEPVKSLVLAPFRRLFKRQTL
jgi:hypothetical protein